jgi:phospholipid/cholesterol/gamma-HCH transport system permease protein
VTFFNRLEYVLMLRHVYIGLAKAPLFAFVIALISCRLGLIVEDNARSVGINTTATVVQSVVAVILLDAACAVALQQIGW